MKKVLFGTVLGISATLIVQNLYNKHGKFYALVENVKSGLKNREQETELAVEGAERALNFFDKASLVWRRLTRIVRS
jgi:hypothetical protein